jgi:hypothetical protein
VRGCKASARIQETRGILNEILWAKADELVCYCRDVPKATIIGAIARGATTVEQVAEDTTACTGRWCNNTNPKTHCCRTEIQALIDFYAHESKGGVKAGHSAGGNVLSVESGPVSPELYAWQLDAAMKYKCDYNPALNIIEVSTYGKGHAQATINMLQQLAKLCNIHKTANVLVDYSQVEAQYLSMEDIQYICNITKSLGDDLKSRKFANVVATDLHFGLLRVWITKTEDFMEMELGLFRNETAAIEWLREHAKQNNSRWYSRKSS